jgi:uncharacterized membrane protein
VVDRAGVRCAKREEGRKLAKARQKHTTSWLRHIRNIFLIGIITAVPLVVTFYVFRWLFDTLDGVFQPIFIHFFGRTLPGAGLIAVIILIFLLGLIATNFVGRRIVHWFDAGMSRIPIIQYIYVASKQVVDALRGLRQVSFRKVVVVEFPKAGMYSLGFITGKPLQLRGQEKIPVFIPHTPNPMTGFLVLLPEGEIFDTALSIEQAMRMILSGGLLCPDTISNAVCDTEEIAK